MHSGSAETYVFRAVFAGSRPGFAAVAIAGGLAGASKRGRTPAARRVDRAPPSRPARPPRAGPAHLPGCRARRLVEDRRLGLDDPIRRHLSAKTLAPLR